MDRATCRRLAALNRCFYHRFAAAFAATRRAPWPGWRRLAAHLRAPAGGRALHVLDLGCGNGRFAAFCASALPCPVAYVGVDGSAAMLELAEQNLAGLERGELVRRDLGRESGAPLPAGPFDLVVLLGVLHHLPGAATRRGVLLESASRLAPGGVLACTVWRFASQPRFAGKIIPWEELNRRLRRPLDPGQLENGDVLLSFAANPGALRYCHGVAEAELASWLDGLPPVIDDYQADGATGDLNRYLLVRAASGARRS